MDSRREHLLSPKIKLKRKMEWRCFLTAVKKNQIKEEHEETMLIVDISDQTLQLSNDLLKKNSEQLAQKRKRRKSIDVIVTQLNMRLHKTNNAINKTALQKISKASTPGSHGNLCDTPNPIQSRTNHVIEEFLDQICFNGSYDINTEELTLSEYHMERIVYFACNKSATNAEELQKIVNFVENKSSCLMKYIWGMNILESLGQYESDKYDSLLRKTKKCIVNISQFIPRNSFDRYLEYIMWMYEKRRKI